MTETSTIAQRNATFAAMAPHERRVAIAKETIARLASGSIRPSPGSYLRSPDGSAATEGKPDDCALLGDLQAYIDAGNVCEVCAIGGMMAARAALGNHVQLGEDSSVSREQVEEALAGEFGKDLLEVVEVFYEREWRDKAKTLVLRHIGSDPTGDGLWARIFWDAGQRRESHEEWVNGSNAMAVWDALEPLTDAERMVWCMRNIVHNEGSFVAGEVRIEGDE